MPTETRSTTASAEAASATAVTASPTRCTSSAKTNIAGAAILLVLLSLTTTIFAPLRPSQRFGYDESDYMYAVSKGFLANYSDTPTLSLLAFVRAGVQGLKPSNWTKLSESIRRSDDIALYRHYHGPLHFYSILIAKAFVGHATERPFRLVAFAALLLAAVILFLGSTFVIPEYGAVAGCLSALFLLTSPNNLETAMWLVPHTLYVATALIALFLMAKFAQSPTLSYLYASVICIAIAFTAIEYAILLILTLLIITFINRQSLQLLRNSNYLKIAGVCIGLFFGTVALLWPGGLFKFTLAKDYLFFLYFSTVRSAAAYGTDSLAEVWHLRLRSSPIEGIVLLMCVGVFIGQLFRKQCKSYLLPFAIYAGLVALTVFRNRSGSPFYISSLLPPLYFILAALIVELLKRARRAGYVVAALVAAAFVVSGYLYAYRPLSQPQTTTPTDGVVQVLSGIGQNRTLLVPHDFVPTIHYYFPSNKLTPYPDTWTPAQLINEIRSSRYDGLVYVGQNYNSLERDVRSISQSATLWAKANNGDLVVAYVPFGRDACR